MSPTHGEDNADRFETEGGVHVARRRTPTPYATAIDGFIEALDTRRGAVFSSNYEYPGRYTRWDTAIVDPPVAISARGRILRVEALNGRGQALMPALHRAVSGLSDVTVTEESSRLLRLEVAQPEKIFTEEERSRAPSVFTVLRAVVGLFRSAEDNNLGLFGAFGYDLAFQFDPVDLHLERPASQRDLLLYLPDEILVADHYTAKAWLDRYDFSGEGFSTEGIAREQVPAPFKPAEKIPPRGDHQPGEYASLVRKAFASFQCGDLFEVVPGQTFYEPCTSRPSEISRRLKAINPSPYSFFINLGENEFLVGASPEMFVRVQGRRVETCPISGTIKRGADAIGDAEQIIKLLNSKKDEAELTMCSDVDRNDKSRVCEPGSVRVIGRRQIEMYSRLIHTVDHIEGRLRADMDAFDAFLSHAWAVTVTGAPKLWAMRFIEENEKSPRAWYGGAVGMVHFNGDLNTGLTLRTAAPRCSSTRSRRRRRRKRNSRRPPCSPPSAKPGPAIPLRSRARRQRSGKACGSCSWTTRTPSSTRWPTTSVRPAPSWPPCARRCRKRCSTGSGQTSWCCPPAQACPGISTAPARSSGRAGASCQSLASAWASRG